MTQLIESVLGGGGEMGERMRAFDWSARHLSGRLVGVRQRNRQHASAVRNEQLDDDDRSGAWTTHGH